MKFAPVDHDDRPEFLSPSHAWPIRRAFARRPVLAIAAVAGVTTAWAGSVRAFQHDELYFQASGRYLAWGYADQPPLVPFWAQLAEAISPGSALVFRLPSALLFVAGIVATAAIAREFGGRTRAQTFAAAAYAVSPGLVVVAQWCATYSFDPHLWTIVLWLVVRAVGRPGRRHYPGLLGAGLVTAVALEVKFLVPVLWVTALTAALAIGPRWLLRRWELWLGLAIASGCCIPTLRWQADHGWPFAQMRHVVTAESPRIELLPHALVELGVISGMVIAGHGLWRLLRSADLAPWRFLGFAAVGIMACLLIVGGRSYYLAGLTGLLIAAGAVGIEGYRLARWWSWSVSGPALAASALIPVMLLPLGPPGWNPVERLVNRPVEITPKVTAGVQAIYAGLPAPERDRTAVVAQTFQLASAVEAFTPLRAYSPHRGYWYFGTPPADADDLLWLGDDPEPLRPWFASINRIPTTSGPAVWMASGRRASWPTIWTAWRTMR